MSNWRKYLGLPHVFGANPDDGEGADCVLMVWNILRDANQFTPALDWAWFDYAQQGRWHDLQLLWDDATYEIDEPEDYAVTLIDNGATGLGVAVVLERGLLMVHHRRGVCWAPTRLLKRMRYYRFRNGDAAI